MTWTTCSPRSPLRRGDGGEFWTTCSVDLLLLDCCIIRRWITGYVRSVGVLEHDYLFFDRRRLYCLARLYYENRVI